MIITDLDIVDISVLRINLMSIFSDGPEGLTCTRENKDRIVEGDEVSFSCTVDSNPRASLKISYFGKMIYHGNRTSFTLPSATCHNKETHIICNAYNEKTEKNIAANISMTFVECKISLFYIFKLIIFLSVHDYFKLVRLNVDKNC